MLDMLALAGSGEHITTLDDETLASVVGGEDWKTWLLRKAAEVVVDCVFGGLDDLIDGIQEGYEDGR
jgi:hypothetical protein